MANVKQLGMATATFSVALAIGFVMQNGNALANRFGADANADSAARFTAETNASYTPATDAAPIEEAIVTAHAGVAATEAPAFQAPAVVTGAAVKLPEAAQPTKPQPAPVQLANLDPGEAPEIEAETTVAVDCVPELTATAGPAASLAVTVDAPCHSNTAFTMHHQGMMFTAVTDEDGKAEMGVPALAEVSVVIAAFDDGDGAVATVAVPDFTSYDRAVLQWQGNTAVMLSAYEDGANYGDSNHIHPGNPGSLERIAASEGGYLVRLGDGAAEDALFADVYTIPSGTIGQSADVMLIAEAEITTDNCGKELNAQSIQISPVGQPSALDLSMVMPDCDAVGDVLILQNMFQDLTIASR